MSGVLSSYRVEKSGAPPFFHRHPIRLFGVSFRPQYPMELPQIKGKKGKKWSNTYAKGGTEVNRI
jgi:hypothetical protein